MYLSITGPAFFFFVALIVLIVTGSVAAAIALVAVGGLFLLIGWRP